METMRYNHKSFFEIMAGNKTLTNSFVTGSFMSVKAKDGVYPNLTLCYGLNELDNAAFEQYNKAVEQKTASPYFISPQSEASFLPETLLKKYGYRAVDQWVSMRLDLDATQTDNTGSGLTVLRVENETQLEQWLQIVSAALFNNRTINPAIFSYLMNVSGVDLWLGLIQGLPVCTALTFATDKAMGLYMVATSPAMQRKGYSTSLLKHVHNYAKESGFECLVLQSTRLGINLYKKMGFREIENQLIYWKTGKEFI